MRNGAIILKTKLKNKDPEATKRVARMIEKTGGNIWEKGGHERAYFNDEFNVNVASHVYAQPFDSYIDIKEQEFVCEVAKTGFENVRNNFNVEDYFELFKKELLSELKYLGLAK